MEKSSKKWAPESYDPKSVGRQQVDIADLVDDEDSSFRLAALSSLQTFNSPHLIERVRALQNDHGPATREAVSALLAKWEGYDERVGAWLRQLKDVDPDVRLQALSAIELRSYGELVSNVAELLDDPVPEIRVAAIKKFDISAGSRYREDFVDQIALALADPDPSVRNQAVWSLGLPVRTQAMTKRVGTLLALLLNDPLDEIRVDVLRALGYLGATEQAGQIANSLVEYEYRPDLPDIIEQPAGGSLAGFFVGGMGP